MREIKFRAWDSEINKMRYEDWGGEESIWGKSYYHFGIDLQGGCSVYSDEDGGKSGLWEHVIDLHDKQYILMQYTGLKDKNGKEIYEGDIVKLRYYKRSVICEVEISHYGLLFKSNHGRRFYLLTSQKDTIEVIGNVYENSYLLDKKTL